MLITFRTPIIDLRHFSSDNDIANSVTLPRGWADGDFVRGLGRIVHRSAGTAAPWHHENAYVDLANAVAFDNLALQATTKHFANFSFGAIRKRVWMALPDSYSLLDMDLSFEVAPKKYAKHTFPRNGVTSVTQIPQLVALLSALPIRVRGEDRGSAQSQVLTVGRRIADRFSRHTLAERFGRQRLVTNGLTTVIVEMPGMSPLDEVPCKSRSTSAGGVTLTTFEVERSDGGKIRVHMVSEATGSKDGRRKVRELRIHVARLHSFSELLRALSSNSVTSPNAPISDEKGTPGFDALQRTLLSCSRSLNAASKPGGLPSNKIFEAAYYATPLGRKDFITRLERTLSAMRPKVRESVLTAVALDKAAVEQAENTYSLQTENRSVVNMSKVNITVSGDNNGNIGERIQVQDMIVSPSKTFFFIGEARVDRLELAGELNALASLLANNEGFSDSASIEAIKDAEVAVRGGNDDVARSRLKRTSEWVLDAAKSVGEGIAAAAIIYTLGMN